MSTTRSAERDERTVAVENVSYRFAFSVLSTLIFYDAAYRSILLHQSVWDLLAWVFLSFGVAYVYQAREDALPRGRLLKRMLLIALVFGILGAIFGVVLSIIRST